jgi:hypothetical protein
LWESETVTDAEVRAMEMKLIREAGANDPAKGYNKLPRHCPGARDYQERYRTSDGSADGFLMPATVHADTSDKRMRSDSCSTTVPAT